MSICQILPASDRLREANFVIFCASFYDSTIYQRDYDEYMDNGESVYALITLLCHKLVNVAMNWLVSAALTHFKEVYQPALTLYNTSGKNMYSISRHILER